MEPVWAEIDLGAIAHNVREIRRVTRSSAKLMAVVKANGYGHGAIKVARTALANGADRLAVARVGEALVLRRNGLGVPIMVLGYTPPEQAEDAIRAAIAQTVYTYQQAEYISRVAARVGRRATVHVKVDTGMGRIGVLPGPEAVRTLFQIARLSHLELEGVFTHFAVADEVDKEFTHRQFDRFLNFAAELERQGLHIPIKHAANSAGIIDLPETHLDMVRPGIILYGLYPSGEVRRDVVTIKPAMTWKCRVAFVKQLDRGDSVSYGRTFIVKQRALVATLPVGYADGYSRLLSNRGEVLVGGRRAPVIGRVCMDQTMIDITHIPQVGMGDEVVLLGRQGDQEVPAEEMAEKIGTINYEVVCKVGARVPRFYHG
ncbi:alanine racemase [Clostridiales bacterium PH28_bin88]|nr:alanine racemase [Clostridiales bacterium PH28_bin88]